MIAPIPRLRDYSGPALLSYGFRPFFLFGSLYAGVAILAWLPMFQGELALSTAFSPRDWHVHEMLYGYLSAVITGFLLTAIPNWTGRLPIQGKPLLVLVLAWAAGRLAVSSSALVGWLPTALIDVSFLLLVAAAAAREIVAGRNWRNLKVLIILGALTAGNIAFHLEAHVQGAAAYGLRLGIGAVVALIMLMGGRIIPSFTRNWLARANPGRLPAPFSMFDIASMAMAALALLMWVVQPESRPTGVALILAGGLQFARLARWAGDRTIRDPLVLVLHVAYVFVPLGFLLVGLSAFGLLVPSAGIHTWTAGAFGGMTLAVMSRASLGHTGRTLIATKATQTIYGLIFLAALTRVCAALEPNWSTALLHIAGVSWAAAFLGFGIAYWGVLTRPRVTA